MEITLRYPDGAVTYKQDDVNFITMKKALEWAKEREEQQKAIMEMAKKSIDEDISDEAEDFLEQFDPYESLAFTADLIVSFFGGQFTYDDFLKYAFFKNSFEYHSMGEQIFELAFNARDDIEEEANTKGKKKKRTS